MECEYGEHDEVRVYTMPISAAVAAQIPARPGVKSAVSIDPGVRRRRIAGQALHVAILETMQATGEDYRTLMRKIVRMPRNAEALRAYTGCER
jgi:hypothetical protein